MRILSLLRQLLEAASTLFLVTAIAAFVWLYAEQKTVHDQVPLDLDVEYGTPDEQRDYAIITPNAPRKISVSFKASNKVADSIRSDLKKMPAFAIPLYIDSTKDQVRQTFSMRERLEKSLFHNLAASNIKVAQDPEVSFTADRLKSISIPLRVEAGKLSTIGLVEWEAHGDTATALLTATLADAWKNNKDIYAIARLDQIDKANLKPGEKTTRKVQVEIPALEHYPAPPDMKAKILERMVLSPASINATFTLDKAASADLRLTRPVPVTISAPPSLLNDWSFSIPAESEKFLSDLRLTCTDEAKARIEMNESSKDRTEGKLVWAVVRVPSDEIPANGLLTLPLEVMTPAGAAVSASTLLPKTVTVKAVRRTP